MAAAAIGQAKAGNEVDLTKCWAFPTGDAVGEALASDGVRVFVGLGGGNVEALSLDGKKMWSSELGGGIGSNILAGGSVFLVTSTVSSETGKAGGSVLRSLSKETGITNWTFKLPDAERHFLKIYNGSVVVVSKSGVIQAIDAKSGEIKWKREVAEAFAAEPEYTAEKVLVATSDKQIFTVKLVSGEIDSIRKMIYAVSAVNETALGETVAGDERGNVSLLLTGTDKPDWRFKSGGKVSDIFTVGDHLLVTSHDNFIYFLSSRNGSMGWKKRLPGRVSQIATIMYRYALVSSFDEHAAVFTDLSNGKVAGQIAFGDAETLVYSPVAAGGLIFVLTNEAVYGYSLNGCKIRSESPQ